MESAANVNPEQQRLVAARIVYSAPNGEILEVSLVGDWLIYNNTVSEDSFLKDLQNYRSVKSVNIKCQELKNWDSSLLVFLSRLGRTLNEKNIKLTLSNMPDGIRRLLNLAAAVPEREGARRTNKREPFLAEVGNRAVLIFRSTRDMVSFLGELTIVFGKFLLGKARFRRSDLWEIVEECGPNALPIVTLISTLVGLILAFIGAIQLAQFGAQIYVANLVGIAMLREMGAIMAGIILAGRTGAAFAAQLGTMEVNEEIDALKTFGIAPMEFLVLPRALGLALMMPLLCLYADLMGILGGAIIGIAGMELSPKLYIDQTINAIGMSDFLLGVIKSVIFGILVAVAGCLRGIQCGRSASAVGQAATSAVVTSIVLIVVTDAIFAIVCNIIGV